MHKLLSISAYMPLGMDIAPLGQIFMQHPQATHSRMFTIAFLFAIMNFLLFFTSIQERGGRFSDGVTYFI
jgi:hypothetical protein